MSFISPLTATKRRLEALGFDPDLAGTCAWMIGDTPVNCGDSIWVNGEAGAILAVIPERKVFGGRSRRPGGVPEVILMRGPVDAEAEHVALRSGQQVLARLAPKNPAKPEAGLYLIDWLVPREHPKTSQWTKEIRQELEEMFIAKSEREPRGYLLYHCGTAANGYAAQDEGFYFAGIPADPQRSYPMRT